MSEIKEPQLHPIQTRRTRTPFHKLMISLVSYDFFYCFLALQLYSITYYSTTYESESNYYLCLISIQWMIFDV